MRRVLVVNGDDFGFTEGVNLGVVEAFERGVLRSATLMANGAAFEHAVELARRHPGLDVGCHLVLVGGRAVAPPRDKLPVSLGQLFFRLARGWRRPQIEAEFRAQLDRLLEAGVRPTHLDTHKHTHLAPPVLAALLGVAREYEIGWVRRPFDLPLSEAHGGAALPQRLLTRALRPLQRSFERKLLRFERRAADHFAGFQMTGRLRTRQLAGLIRALPEGVTEFMCHPGRCTADLLEAQTRLKQSREEELAALTSPEVREAVRESGVLLAGFGDLPDPGRP